MTREELNAECCNHGPAPIIRAMAFDMSANSGPANMAQTLLRMADILDFAFDNGGNTGVWNGD